MSYQVIARKYRPQRFADVVGQNHVTQTLSNAIASGRIAHAYLFCGPRGTGKTTLARIFAKCLNCTGGPLADFPEDDPRAKEIAEGRSLDVVEIDGASNNGVDQVRELRETARFAPASSKFKIYIIDEVHMLSTAAFNALLKTLEEPPSHVKFLFATTDPEKVLPTILSRCQRFDLRRIPTALIVKHLSWIATQEGVSIDDAALHAIARGADGGMRDAESTLDQLISFCGNQIVESDVLSMFGLAARSQLLGLSSAIIEGDAAQALTLLDELARNGKDLSRLLGDLLNHFRNLLLFQLTKGDKNLIEASEIELGVLAAEAKRIETEPLSRIMEVFSTAESRLRDAASRRIFLEVTLLKAIQARESSSLDAVLKQLQALRQAAPAEGAKASRSAAAATSQAAAAPSATVAPTKKPAAAETAPAPAPVTPPAPVPEARVSQSPPTQTVATVAPAPTVAPPPAPAKVEPPVAAPPVASGTDPIQAWNAVVNGLSMMQRHYFEEAQPTAYNNNVLTVSYPVGSDSFELANSRDILNALQAQYAANGFANLAVKLIENPQLQGAPKPAARPNPSPNPAPRPQENAPQRQDPKAATANAKPQPMTLSKDEFLNDPLIRAALEVFKATLVEVRAPSPESAA